MSRLASLSADERARVTAARHNLMLALVSPSPAQEAAMDEFCYRVLAEGSSESTAQAAQALAEVCGVMEE